MVDLREYVAAGYFLSRYTGEHDCSGTELRRVTLAHDHSQRRFFPESWTLSWCSESHEERVERAASFGIAEPELERVMAWADQSFDSEFGAWDVFFTLDGAREAARSFLPNAARSQDFGVRPGRVPRPPSLWLCNRKPLPAVRVPQSGARGVR